MSAAHKYIDLETQVQDSQTYVEITMGGITGKMEWSGYGMAAHGKWASHTGFRSLGRDIDTSNPQRMATELYEANEKLPFLVGEEHREHGWKSIDTNYRGEIQVRLPKWHNGVVAACLERYGMTNTCTLNNYWCFPESMHDVSKKLASKLLAPIAAPHTRFGCEAELASRIDAQARELGYLPGQSLSDGVMQASLF